MKQTMVMGNWKMNGSAQTVSQLLKDILQILPGNMDAQCVVFPPAIYLPLVQSLLANTSLSWGAQNVYPREAGAYTGELSAPMLRDYHCRYVLIGHSERRHLFHEGEKFVAEKFHHVKDHDMIPVLCVGETLEERKQGLTEDVITRQLLAVTQNGSHVFRNCIVAYEPVWAIGTGQTALPEQAQEVHEFIRSFVAQYDQEGAQKLTILYGGSVNDENARTLFAMPDIDGGLVGGASLNAQQFVEIVKCIN
ncbi:MULTISPECIES: triose-phosphate isomerase [Legionella]|uniref:Triosephosphate isomerase n=1 Tax=Legionella septentrionalis TaxID=2498109 RepID=A0A433JL43_9GAMM|nr:MULTISPECIES: triose-phosphate isomerase [Legionella]MCP0912825.1 triose-phosphate isomerase [Legionella sp. 27cVA30]RUQ89996.1 triose-phosphate isomerase [Legionella septentrionalis]RUQ97827.1 triose-phosphate isomerase [Legionella septentrionalis]RUR16288.1 triose-phosphate isomerase [Legionella septentrionalis]